MSLRQVGIEIRRIVRHPALWAGLAALLLVLALFVFVRHSQVYYGYLPPVGTVEQDLLAGLAFFNWIGGFVYAVTASVIVAYDYPARSLQLWLTRGLSRPTLSLARLAVILLFSGLVVCFSVLATSSITLFPRSSPPTKVTLSYCSWT